MLEESAGGTFIFPIGAFKKLVSAARREKGYGAEKLR